MISIREAFIEDLPIILSMYKELDEEILDIDTAKKFFNEMNECPGYKIYLCEYNNIPAGTFSLIILRNLAHMGARSGLIEDVVVLNSYRSKGIGKEMINFAINICRKNSCYKAALSSNLIRERAHAFYERIGFKKHGYSFTMDLL